MWGGVWVGRADDVSGVRPVSLRSLRRADGTPLTTSAPARHVSLHISSRSVQRLSGSVLYVSLTTPSASGTERNEERVEWSDERRDGVGERREMNRE